MTTRAAACGRVFLWSMLAAGCGMAPEAELAVQGRPIINGQPDTDPAHDAVVALTFGQYMCSGTLISPEVVLTAAHCADGFGPASYTVYFGDELTGAVTRRVSEVRVHPAYNASTITNDIALLRLATPAPASVHPIPYLPRALAIEQPDVGRAIEYVGFGETERSQTGVKLTVTNDLDWICTRPGGCTVGSGYHASQNTICGDQAPGGPCHGDSGGPAFVTRSGQEYVAGVTSYGDQYCQYFGCSTKVDAFEAFIADFVGGLPGTPCAADATCLSGHCVDGICCTGPCNDTCTACNLPGSLGTCAPAPNGTSCSDGNPCNGDEVCLMQACVPGEPPDCRDDNPCTLDGCDPRQGCRHDPVEDGLPCPDADACNGEETCQAGACRAGPPLDCDDLNPCTEDTCEPASGCRHDVLAEGSACGGGRCGAGSCAFGVCVADDPAACDDADPCTRDWCHPDHGCVHQTAPDGYPCGGCMMCIQGACLPDEECVIAGGCATRPPGGDSGGFGMLVLLGWMRWKGRGVRRRR